MKIWVDADACPAMIRDVLFKAAERTALETVFVANHALTVPPSKTVRTLRVAAGFDVADDVIVGRLEAGDVVVTADIPLAAEVIARGGHALNPRGELYAADTIGQKLAMRDFLDVLRGSGIHGGGPPALTAQDRKAFADALDRLLTRLRPARG